MGVKDFSVKRITYKTCKAFCLIWHYSQTCPPGKLYYGLYDGVNLIGVICYGEPAMRFQKACYKADIELRRLCCVDDTPKNTESFFIGSTLKKLKKMGYSKVLSLADPRFNHTGLVYRASNFMFEGEEKGGGSRLVIIDGVEMHSRTAFAKYGASGKKSLLKILPLSDIRIINKPRKLAFTYQLNRKKRNVFKEGRS